MNLNRRSFLRNASAVTAGFSGLEQMLSGSALAQESKLSSPYGELLRDPHKIIDLPKGFSYRVISRTGDRMNDGFKVPGQPDGMGAFSVGNNQVVLVRNHEIGHSRYTTGPLPDNKQLPDNFDRSLCYDPGRFDAQPFVGGTTSVVYNTKTQEVETQYLSLFGTDRNCAGGITPWGSWVTCEEPADMTSKWGKIHGYCFEVPAGKKPKLHKPVALKAMGRFRHEAIAVHPSSGIVYLTEDRNDGVFYRFIPKTPGKLAEGGRLQAMVIRDKKGVDTRNWPQDKSPFPLRQRMAVDWIDLEDVESEKDELRFEAIENGGAAKFSRAEGIWYGSPAAVGEETFYFACTDGGLNQKGQIFRYFPSQHEGSNEEAKSPGEVELYLEPNDNAILKNADNLTISSWGELVICEDTSGDNHLRAVNRKGEISTLARNAMNSAEFAGACFDPSGDTLFVNIQSPGVTLAISGPFQKQA